MLSDPRSTPARLTRLAALFGAATALWLATAGCELGDGDCLRMSDCDDGYACVEGTCRSNRASDAPPSKTPDAGPRSTTRADAALDVMSDAGDAGDASIDADASTLDGSADAAP